MTPLWWKKRPRRVADKPAAAQPSPAWPDLPKWGAVAPVARMEDELIGLRARIGRVEQELRDLSKRIDVRAQAARRQR